MEFFKARGRPCFAVLGAAAHPIGSDCQFPVRPLAAKHELYFSGHERLTGRDPVRFAPGQPDLGVAPTDPVQQQNKFSLLGVDIDHRLLYQQPDPALSGAGVNRRRVPDKRQIRGEMHHAVTS